MYDFARVIRFACFTGVSPTLLIFVTAGTEETGRLQMNDYVIVFSCQLLSCFCSTVRIYGYAKLIFTVVCKNIRDPRSMQSDEIDHVNVITRLISNFLTNEFL